MFDGVPEQLNQFIASSRASSQLPIPLSSFPLNNSSTNNSLVSSFDAYSNQVLLHHQPQFLNPILHQQSLVDNSHKIEEKENNLVPINLENIERERRPLSIQEVPIHENIDHHDDATTSWSNEEVIALFKIRSNTESWFPQFTWDHVSRKLADLGFKRSAEKCKEKFEEENRYFNNITLNKNYRILSELEELYHGDQNQKVIGNPSDDQGQAKRGKSTFEESNQIIIGKDFEGNNDDDGDGDEIKVVEMRTKKRKRKRQNKFEMLKGFCKDVVKKMMVQQEEVHHKLIEDMVKRDREKVEKEEALKKQEMDRMNKELEIMVKEQALASDRQVSIIELLKKFTSSQNEGDFNISLNKVLENSNSSNCVSPLIHKTQNPNPSCDHEELNSISNCTQNENENENETIVSQNPNSIIAQNKIPNLPSSPKTIQSCQNPSSLNTPKSTITPTSPSLHKDDIGKRWPRDEVLALINLRSSLCSNSEEKDGVKAPLWERISQGMLNLGFKRSSKRCKEKWENINKYFRKTKDINKKRSVESRTCPYFHILSTLYSQGTLNASLQEGQENCLASSDQNLDCSQLGLSDSSMHKIGHEGVRNLVVQVPSNIASDIEF